MAENITIVNLTNNGEVPEGYFDLGDVALQSSQDIQFRVRNNSTLYRANDVVVFIEDAPPLSSTPLSDQILLSIDELKYTQTISLGDLYPLQISSIITLRTFINSDTDLGNFNFNVVASSAGWE